MKRTLFIIFFLAASSVLFSQTLIETRCPYKGSQIPDNRIKEVGDFTITTTDGITRNLYNTLDSGKTVFIDLFFTTCSWCQLYAPIIEEVYQDHGAGAGDIEFWGISNNLNDPDDLIDQYKANFNISNPCAGPDGGGTTAHTTVISGQDFLGWPTYCVICPDRTMYFDPVYPPTVTGFDPYFETCAAMVGIDQPGFSIPNPGIKAVYPNPASTELYLQVAVNEPGPVAIEIYNLLGSKVSSVSRELSRGSQTLAIPVSELSNGFYFIRLRQNNSLLDTQKAWIWK